MKNALQLSENELKAWYERQKPINYADQLDSLLTVVEQFLASPNTAAAKTLLEIAAKSTRYLMNKAG